MANLQKSKGKITDGPSVTILVGIVIISLVSLQGVGLATFSTDNLYLILNYLALPLLIGMFASFSLLAGVVDLSIGSMVALSAATFAVLATYNINLWLCALLAVLVCLFFGAINGIAIIGFNANPIAVTLGMLVALRGLARIVNKYDNSDTLSSDDGTVIFIDGLNTFTESSISFLPWLFVIALALTFILQVVISKTRYGRHIKAVGGDLTAAVRAGLPASRIKFTSLLISAGGAGIAGVLFVGKLGSSSSTLGTGMEFTVYAALMIGGYSILRGGVGNPVGAFLGLFVIAYFTNYIDNMGFDTRFADVFIGALLIAIVYLDIRRGGDTFE
jgi:ribose/xylose/arabinose/galactoside ABC-type transport system permease subunit